MATLVLRQIKGSPITDAEMDSNFTNLNRDSFLSVRNSTPWVASTAFTKGEILNVTDKFYFVSVGGTSGTTAPSHTTGSAANGSLVLQATTVASYSAKDVLEKIKYLDGQDSGLDADLVRGLVPSVALPATSDKSSLVSRSSTGDSVFNNLTAAGIVTGTLSATGISTTTLAITGNITLAGSAGTTGQVLVSGGLGAVPSWTTINPNLTITTESATTGIKYLPFVDGTGVQGLKSVTGLNYNLATNSLSIIAAGNPKYGANTFTDHQTVPADAYSNTWDNNLTVPTKAAVYTKIQSLNKPGEICYFASRTAPEGFLKANGAVVSIDAYTDLANAIYCGDSLNATAPFGFKCNDPANATTTRSTTGTFIALPDLRGEFIRSWDDSRGIDAGRTFGSSQGDAIRNITGNLFQGGQQTITGGNGAFAVTAFGGMFYDSGGGSGPSNFNFDASRVVPTAAENRPRNVALLVCIRY